MTELIVDSNPWPNRLNRPPIIPTPIDTLPNELLAHIFTIGAKSDFGRISSWSSRETLFSLLVSSICRRWRATALCTPSVWSCLAFTIDPQSKWRCEHLYLPRSGAHPLDIIIDNADNSFDDEYYQSFSIEKVWRVILPHSERWRRLYVGVGGIIEHTWHAMQNISMPLLQHLELMDERGHISYDVNHATAFQPNAPALKSVSLHLPCVECGPPLVNLTALLLDLAGLLSQLQLEGIVASCPALRVLCLRSEGLEGFKPRGIAIPSLIDLSLSCQKEFYGDSVLFLLSIIIAPALQSLELASCKSSNIINALQIHQKRALNHPRPRILKLFRVQLSPTLFTFFPNTTFLYLIDSYGEFTFSGLPALESITYCNRRRYQDYSRQDNCFIEQIRKHIQECHGGSQALKSIRACRLAPKFRETLGDLVDIVEVCEDVEVDDRDEYGTDDDLWNDYPETGADFEGIWDSD